jgi:GTP cyclohydrolase II
MSNLKYDTVVRSGIEVDERIVIRDDLIPSEARVEIDAKRAAGYYSETEAPDASGAGST